MVVPTSSRPQILKCQDDSGGYAFYLHVWVSLSKQLLNTKSFSAFNPMLLIPSLGNFLNQYDSKLILNYTDFFRFTMEK